MKLFDKNNILIVRLSSIGDVILTTPVIRAIRSKYPESRIDFLTSQSTTSLLANSQYIDNLFGYDKSNYNNIQILKNNIKESLNFEKYDIAIDLQNNLRSKMFLNGLYKKKFSLNKNRLYKLVLVNLKKQISDPKHIVDRYFTTIKDLEVYPDDLGCEIFLTNETDIWPPKNEKIRIGIAPGAKHHTKRWLAEYFAKLSDLISLEYNSEFFLLGSNDEKNICEEINHLSNCNFHNYAGTLSLLDTAKLIEELDIVISNDSAIMHLASAKSTPILAIFCSTVPELGFTPYKAKYEIAQNTISCRPCTHIGRSNCPKKHFNCAVELYPEFVFDKFELIIKKYELAK